MGNNNSNSLFITVEGGEGVGKSLFCQGLRATLEQLGKKVFLTREPGGTAVGQAVRKIFLEPPGGEELSSLTELFLVSASRAQHVQGPIQQHLSCHHWVLCDRFFDSTRVYQGILGGIDASSLESVVKASVGRVIPDVTFLLDCDTQTIMSRLGQRAHVQETSRFDAAPESYHSKLRQAFIQVAQAFPERFEVLDAGQDPASVQRDAVTRLTNRGLLLPSS